MNRRRITVALSIAAAILGAHPASAFPLKGGAAAASVALTSVQLSSPTSATSPFSFGVTIKKGLSTAGSVVVTDATSSQCVIQRSWNDGSAKMVVCSGTEALVANTPAMIHVSTGTAPGGTPLACTDIQSAAPTAQVSATGTNGFSAVTLTSVLASPIVGLVTPSKPEIVSGPEYVSCIYKAFASTGVMVRFYVERWKSGIMRVRVAVENGWQDQTLGTMSYSATATVGGNPAVALFGSAVTGLALTQYDNTRWSAIGWIGASDPQMMAQQAPADVAASKLMPNYWPVGVAGATTLNGLVQSYTPMGNGPWTLNFPDPGPQAQIALFPQWDALLETNPMDARAYKAVLVAAESINSYGIVWRRHSDSDLPIHPSASYGNLGCTCNEFDRGSLHWENAHQGSAGIFAYETTGDYYYYESALLQVGTDWLTANNSGDTSNGSLLFENQDRAAAWNFRGVEQLDSIAPTNDVALAGFQKLIDDNSAYSYGIGNALTSQVGMFYVYAPNSYGDWFEQMWEQHFYFIAIADGVLREYGSSMTNITNLASFAAKMPLGELGTTATTGFCYNQSGYNGTQVGPINISPPVTGTAALLANLRTSWADTFTASVASSPVNGATYAGGPCPSGSAIISSGGVGDWQDCISSGWSSIFAASALLVDLGATIAPGGATARGLLEGASNFGLGTGSFLDCNDETPSGAQNYPQYVFAHR